MVPIKQKLRIINSKAIGDVLYDALHEWKLPITQTEAMGMSTSVVQVLKERYKSQVPKKEKVKQMTIE